MLEKYIPKSIKSAICRAADNDGLEEIRLRCGKPVVFNFGGRFKFSDKSGKLTENMSDALFVSGREVEDTLALITSNSVYAYKEDMARGFITLAEGHRAGICGDCVESKDTVSYIRHVTGINIRIAREIKGCADGFEKNLLNKNVIVIAPPGCGKTTLLRDIARLLSQSGKNVCVADERREIAPVYDGRFVFDTGINTDVLSGCRKTAGMYMLLRSMNPDVIITDELTKEDIPVVRRIMKSGVKVVASYHGESASDFYTASDGAKFDTVILLDRTKKARVAI